MNDALRLAFGTLTALRVPAPRTVDRRTGATAMALAPLVGAALGALVLVVGLLGDVLGLAPAVCAVLCVGALAVLTRAIHLDGLADTADGLASGRRGADALAVMTRSDIGPFGVVTLLLVLLVQTTALAQAWSAGHGPAAFLAAAVVSRAALPLACRHGVPAAKPTGLGAAVAASVGPTVLVAVLVVSTGVAAALGLGTGGPGGAARAATAAVLALAASTLLVDRCVRRLGGVSGDVMGAAVETAFAVALLVSATTPH